MFGARDIVWSIVLCTALTVLFQCRPAWDARRFVERESQAGFLEAYAGHRWLTGEIIAPPGGGVTVDPMAVPVSARRFEIKAEQVGWSGNKAEFVARHFLELAGRDASQEVHVKLEKRAGRWTYTSFAVRGKGELADPNSGNPWARALRLGRGGV